MTQTYDIIVIGEGITGLTAANRAARDGLAVATFEAELFGGLVINVNELDGYPEDRMTSGTDLASELMQANAEAGVTSIQEPVTAIRPAGAAFEVATGGGAYGARQVVIASGAKLKKLGVPGESEFEGRGVSSCADCDAPMFQNEEVVVVGGGDSALQEALVLARFCRKVHLLHRGTSFRARQHWVDRVRADDRISVLWNTVAEEILGGDGVQKVRMRNTADGSRTEIACAGFFAYVGLAPNSAFLPPAVARDATGAVVTDSTLETALPGVWAAGAVRAGYSGLLPDAVDEARRAAQAAAARLKE